MLTVPPDAPGSNAGTNTCEPPVAAVVKGGGATYRILVIDDSRLVADISRMVLEGRGHSVALASDGASALEVAGAFQPQAVLCDLSLPGGMSGYDVARELRQRCPSSYLIAATAHVTDEHRTKAAEAGFDRYLVKPLDFPQLEQILATALEV